MVKRLSSNRDVVGSSPARYWAFFLLYLLSSASFIRFPRGGATLLIFQQIKLSTAVWGKTISIGADWAIKILIWLITKLPNWMIFQQQPRLARTRYRFQRTTLLKTEASRTKKNLERDVCKLVWLANSFSLLSSWECLEVKQSFFWFMTAKVSHWVLCRKEE